MSIKSAFIIAAAFASFSVLPGQASSSAQKGKWTPLFNGKDLTGWTPVNVAPNTFTVKNGMIVSTGVPTGVMRTNRMYENFIMEADWRHMVKDGNAGIFIWADPNWGRRLRHCPASREVA